MLKLVDNGSLEHRIYQTILQHRSLFIDPRTFLASYRLSLSSTRHTIFHRYHAFVSCPFSTMNGNMSYLALIRWGTNLYIKDMQDAHQVLTFIRCLLEVRITPSHSTNYTYTRFAGTHLPPCQSHCSSSQYFIFAGRAVLIDLPRTFMMETSS